MNASTVQNAAARHSWASAGWIHRAAQSAASFGVNLASRHPATDPASKPRARQSTASAVSGHARRYRWASAGDALAVIHGAASSGSGNPSFTHRSATPVGTEWSRQFSAADAVNPRHHHGHARAGVYPESRNSVATDGAKSQAGELFPG